MKRIAIVLSVGLIATIVLGAMAGTAAGTEAYGSDRMESIDVPGVDHSGIDGDDFGSGSDDTSDEDCKLGFEDNGDIGDPEDDGVVTVICPPELEQ